MTTYIARRFLVTIPVLILISAITFFAVALLPGDLAIAMLGMEADTRHLEALREQLGLNRPVVVRYFDWVGDALQGDLGRSARAGKEVSDLIAKRLEVSIELGILAMLIATAIGIPLGLLAGARPNTILDYGGTALAVLGAAIPNFWLALMLILLFSVQFRWFPAVGFTSFLDDPVQNLRSVALPAFAVGVTQAAILARQTRAALVDVLRQDYVRTAYAKGLRERSVIVRHAFRNALIPVVTVMGIQVSTIVGGFVIIESVFNLPGVGKLLVDSVFQRELQTVQAIGIMLAGAVALTNLAVDVSYAFLDPRIRYE